MSYPGPSPSSTAGVATLHQDAAAEPSIRRNLLMVYGVTALDVTLSLLANVVVPLAASKDVFGDYRKVLLYAGYAGFSHLGLLSGMYLAVVGKRDDEIDWQLLRVVRRVLVATQAALLAVLLVGLATMAGGASGGWLGVVSVACWGAMNLATFHNYFLQGTNRFTPYFRVNVAVKFGAVAMLLLAVFLRQASTSMLVLAFVLPIAATVLAYEAFWRNVAPPSGPVSIRRRWPDVVQLWKRGMVLHLANVCLLLLFTMATFAVSLLFSPVEFADFAFVSGLVTVLYLGVDGLTAAVTPMLARTARSAGRDASYAWYAGLIWVAPAVYWVAAPAVQRFVPAYAGSIPTLLVLCLSLPMSLIVRSRAVAVETAAGRQGALFRFAVSAFACATIAVLAAYAIGRTPHAVAIGWTIAMMAIGASRYFAVDQAGRPGHFERRLVVDAAIATALFYVCAGAGQHAGFIALYAAGAAVAVGVRLSARAAGSERGR